VLNVTAAGPTLDEARDRAYAAVAQIAWEGMRYRTDIAAPAPSFSPTRPAELDVRSSLSW
jgi:phosphoribosylamine--glycine ligase